MSIAIESFSANEYSSTVYDDNTVEISKDGIVIDKCGPWGDIDGALAWANAIVGKYATLGLPKPPSLSGA